MQVSRIETFLVAPRWLFCRVETDDGHVGWGEPVVEGRAETVRAAVHELAGYLIGRDPLRIEDHWQVLTRGGFYRGGAVLASAVAGLDQALWDIAGKARGLPVHELLGGPVRESVRVYGWIGGDEPAEVGEAAAAQVAKGLTAVKMTASGRLPRLASAADVQGVVDRVAAVREVLGPDLDVAIDVHGRASAATARQLLAALTDLHPLFVEEPLLPEHGHLMPRLVAGTSIPIATGERLYSRSDFLPVLQAGIAVAQPDLSHAGGITEVRRIASLVETFDVALAPHCPLGPIALAASLQVDLLSPNFLIQEQSLGVHYNAGSDLLDYVVDRSVFAFADGSVRRPLGPGLGIEVDEAAVRAADKVGHSWRSPVWRHQDGSLAEW
jgi:galactonate dehydratase